MKGFVSSNSADAPHGPDFDQCMFERVLNTCEPALRPQLLRQIIVDLEQIAARLGGTSLERQVKAAHELKGLAATIGANLLAKEAARFCALAPESAASVRSALALGLSREITSLSKRLQGHLEPFGPTQAPK